MKEFLQLVSPDQQQQLLAFLINGPDFVSLSSMEGMMTFVNVSGRQLVGLETSEEAHRPNSEYLMPFESERLSNEINPTLVSDARWIGKITYRHFKTGEPIPVHATTMLIYDEKTRMPAGYATIARDLREEVKALTQQQKLITLVNHSKDLMSLLTLNGTNEYINKAGQKLLGIEHEPDVAAIHISTFHTEDQLSFVAQELLPEVMSKGVWSGRFAAKHYQTGEIIPLENNCVRIDDPYTGKPSAIGAVMRDLRPEIEAQETVRRTERQFRELIMHAPVAIGLLEGPEFIITAANPYILALWDKKDDIIGLPLIEALPEIRDQEFVLLLRTVRETGESHYGNEILARLKRNGNIEDAYFNFVYAKADEKNDHVIVIATEVTQQVLDRKELKESEMRFRSLILQAPMATALYKGKDLVIEIANAAMLALWGKDDTVIGKPLGEALPELADQPFIPRLHQIMETGETYHAEMEKADLVIAGVLQQFWFNYTYKPLHTAHGAIYGVLNMAVDVSSLVRLQKIKDDFIGLASHELKTPITTIKGYAQLLQLQLKLEEHSIEKRMLDKVSQQIDKLTQLIVEMLDVTHINAGKLTFNPIVFELNKLLNGIVEDLRPVSGKHVINMDIGDCFTLFSDPDKIEQVISNLLSNAIKYSPGADKIIVSATSDEDFVTVSVRDFGIGVAEENRLKIFEQFFRVNENQPKTYPGLGLGLYISAQFIKRAGGSIWVEPANGGGSLFCFKLPLYRQ